MSPSAWHILRDDVLLGTFTVEAADQPWFSGTFEPTPAFEPLRPLFDAAYRTILERPLDWTAFEAAYKPIRDAGLRMEATDESEGFDDFLVNVQGRRMEVNPNFSSHWRGQRPPGGTRKPPDALEEEVEQRRVQLMLDLTLRNIHYRIEATAEGHFTIQIILPGEHWEVRPAASGQLTIEKLRRTGEVLVGSEAEQALANLLSSRPVINPTPFGRPTP